MTVAETPQRRRRGAAIGDMARSLGLMAVVVGVVLLTVPSLLRPGKGDRFPGIDEHSYLSGFEQVTGIAPLAPTGLSDGWRATAGALTGDRQTQRLHLGFATPAKRFAGLDEGVASAANVVRSVLGQRGTAITGTQQISMASGGQVAWQQRMSSRGEQALTATIGRVTVVVTGSASLAELTELAGSLR